MSKILEKQLDKANKVHEMKLEKEKVADLHREIAIKSMIQKEKVQEAIYIIAKSPTSRAAQQRLLQFSFLKKEEQPVDPLE